MCLDKDNTYKYIFTKGILTNWRIRIKYTDDTEKLIFDDKSDIKCSKFLLHSFIVSPNKKRVAFVGGNTFTLDSSKYTPQCSDGVFVISTSEERNLIKLYTLTEEDISSLWGFTKSKLTWKGDDSLELAISRWPKNDIRHILYLKQNNTLNNIETFE